MNCIPSQPDFLPSLRSMCNKFGALMIIDEVMTGFRVALGGAQSYYNVLCFGKILGDGMNVSAFGSRSDIIKTLAPIGLVYKMAHCPATRLPWHPFLPVCHS